MAAACFALAHKRPARTSSRRRATAASGSAGAYCRAAPSSRSHWLVGADRARLLLDNRQPFGLAGGCRPRSCGRGSNSTTPARCSRGSTRGSSPSSCLALVAARSVRSWADADVALQEVPSHANMGVPLDHTQRSGPTPHASIRCVSKSCGMDVVFEIVEVGLRHAGLS